MSAQFRRVVRGLTKSLATTLSPDRLWLHIERNPNGFDPEVLRAAAAGLRDDIAAALRRKIKFRPQPCDIDDAVQDAFVAFDPVGFSRDGAVDRARTVAYLAGIAYHLFVDAAGRRKAGFDRLTAAVAGGRRQAPASADPTLVAEYREEAALLAANIGRIDPRLRAVLEQRLEGKSYREMREMRGRTGSYATIAKDCREAEAAVRRAVRHPVAVVVAVLAWLAAGTARAAGLAGRAAGGTKGWLSIKGLAAGVAVATLGVTALTGLDGGRKQGPPAPGTPPVAAPLLGGPPAPAVQAPPAPDVSKLSFNEVALSGPKLPPGVYVTRVDWDVRIGSEDKEREGYLVVEIGSLKVECGRGEHWADNTNRRGRIEGYYRVPSPDGVPIRVGVVDEPAERNVAVEAAVRLTIHLRDEGGRVWTVTREQPMTRFSTDGRGRGASDVRVAGIVRPTDTK